MSLIFLFCGSHLLCFEDLVALRTPLLFLLHFAIKPFFDTIRMEEVPASWNP